MMMACGRTSQATCYLFLNHAIQKPGPRLCPLLDQMVLCLHGGDCPRIDQAGMECLFGQLLLSLNQQVRIRMGRPSFGLPSADRDQVIARRDETVSRLIHIA